MTNKDLEDLQKICDEEIAKAKKELGAEGIKPFDQQYWLGKEHAAKDIFYEILRKHLDELRVMFKKE